MSRRFQGLRTLLAGPPADVLLPINPPGNFSLVDSMQTKGKVLDQDILMSKICIQKCESQIIAKAGKDDLNFYLEVNEKPQGNIMLLHIRNLADCMLIVKIPQHTRR